MTLSSAQLQKALAERVLARRRLLHFTKLTHPRYSAGWVHDDICRRLERFSREVAEGKSPRLMLLMPPRHGKLLADDTMVLTSEGWKTHGGLVKGDKVMGLKGWTEVIGVSPPGLADCEVVTSAGTRIKCHRHHEWGVEEYAYWDAPVAKVGTKAYPKGARPTPLPSKCRPSRRSYRYSVVETLDFLEYKAKNGRMRGAGAPTMRRFYLPSPDFAAYDFSVRKVLQYMRNPRNGGRLAIDDVAELEEPVPGRCIQVAAEDGIYLVTRDFVPTHNSELASIRFPAWHLGHNPTHELINVGYNLELPMKFSRKVREIFRDPIFQSCFPQSQLSPDSQSVEAWNTTTGGGFTAAGVGGGITGKGAHILIVDDPIKNQEEADSVLVRDKLWDWYQSTAYTRLAPGGGVLVIETWWNDDDLAGRLQQAMSAEPDADQFEIVRYPALSEHWEYRSEVSGTIFRYDEAIPDVASPPLGVEKGLTLLRPKDFCLHEDRYPTEALKRIRANLQPRIWSALYQQNPVPDEGMYFKREFFRYQRAMPELFNRRVYTAWDFAIGEKQQNDWTVGVTILQDETDSLYVLDVFRMKGDSFQIVEAILNVAERWGSEPSTGYLMGAEDGQIWRAIEPMLKKRMTERRQYPSYEVLRPMTDKLARARPLQGRMQQGRIVFPQEASWLPQAEQELLRFPAGAHDDVVDALAWVVQLCLGKEPPRMAALPPSPLGATSCSAPTTAKAPT